MEFREVLDRIPDLLSQNLQLEVQRGSEEGDADAEPGQGGPDLTLVADGITFEVEYKHRSRTE